MKVIRLFLLVALIVCAMWVALCAKGGAGLADTVFFCSSSQTDSKFSVQRTGVFSFFQGVYSRGQNEPIKFGCKISSPGWECVSLRKNQGDRLFADVFRQGEGGFTLRVFASARAGAILLETFDSCRSTP